MVIKHYWFSAWMQTTGATLLTVRRCRLARTWMLTQGSRRALCKTRPLEASELRGCPSETGFCISLVVCTGCCISLLYAATGAHENRRRQLANTLSKSAGPRSW